MSSPPTIQKKLAAEFVGTFVFVVVGAGSALGAEFLPALSGSPLLVAALANGLGLAMAVSATMGISGGVLNPAATVGLWVGGKMRTAEVIPYIVVQLAGATAAGAALVASIPSDLGDPVKWGAPTLNISIISTSQGISIEALLTFVLMIAIFGTAVDPRAPKIGGIGIGLAVLADVLVGGNLTGAAMNPARAFGPMIAGGFYPYFWYIYLIGPIIGAAAAGLLYRYALQSPAA